MIAKKYTKPLILVGLLVVWGLIFGFHSAWQSSVSAPPARPIATGRTPGAKGGDGDLPRLKTELLRVPQPA
ncbi:MAG TPA: hypothetical protein VEU07_09610, partial [Candidatus Acidoferrum sp.]|nr:hypothetical protein [Candidatus Acidoferrum sp.]